eukprot:gnl/TRDRNA2_/TRDRNA2_156304_c1_seq1.p1 gnl/TRDRNA2_/TRDRNA2_156304_c1~~gnl/TRDRNA2_/TRDRNA2_156304_c1_seq1.p1  ORF type:complete len:464 (-),score=67.33 gnl/TRDRNA2_/TRDRNA2_156304_c1_seq1:23-1414(-)
MLLHFILTLLYAAAASCSPDYTDATGAPACATSLFQEKVSLMASRTNLQSDSSEQVVASTSTGSSVLSTAKVMATKTKEHPWIILAIAGPVIAIALYLIITSRSATMDYVLSLCKSVAIYFLYIAVSVGITFLNRHILKKDRFRFPLPLVMIQQGYATVVSLTLIKLCPSWYPSMTDPEKKVRVDAWFILQGLLPICTFTATALVLGNMAYRYCSVAFLQMLKESSVVIVFFFSVLASLDSFNYPRFCILVMIIGATTLTVQGAMHVSAPGLIMQLFAMVAQSAGQVIQSLRMKADWKMDPLTFVLLSSPVTSSLLAACLFGTNAVGIDTFHIPPMSDVTDNAGYLVASGTMAFSLNFIIAYLLNENSPVTVSLLGVLKDVLLVVGGIFFFNEDCSVVQAVGFILQICLVFTYSYMKLHPEKLPCQRAKESLVPGDSTSSDKKLASDGSPPVALITGKTMKEG